LTVDPKLRVLFSSTSSRTLKTSIAVGAFVDSSHFYRKSSPLYHTESPSVTLSQSLDGFAAARRSSQHVVNLGACRLFSAFRMCREDAGRGHLDRHLSAELTIRAATTEGRGPDYKIYLTIFHTDAAFRPAY